MAFNAWITGGLHFDGLMDTADGIAAGKEKRLIAMRDSNIGAIGINTLLIIILINISSLIRLNNFAPLALIFANFWGRISPLIAINYFPYLHLDGTGLLHKEHWKGIKKEIIPAFLMGIIIIVLLQVFSQDNVLRAKFIVSFLMGLIPTILIPYLMGRKLNGHSGDSYGSSLVLTETSTMFILSLALP